MQALADKYPDIFYKNWGCQFLGYTYYGFLLNRTMLLEELSASERFFFKDFLDGFRIGQRDEYNRQFVDRVSAYDEQAVERMFMRDIANVPAAFQGLTVQGIGRLVGAEMLFDSLHMPDYPLDSAIGEKFDDELKGYFYRGVGNGFAETLCRYWRRLMPPDAIDCSSYARGLDIEWQRCISLMQQMPTELQPLIWDGFLQELEERELNDSIGPSSPASFPCVSSAGRFILGDYAGTFDQQSYFWNGTDTPVIPGKRSATRNPLALSKMMDAASGAA